MKHGDILRLVAMRDSGIAIIENGSLVRGSLTKSGGRRERKKRGASRISPSKLPSAA
jgi:hypothetical protein